MTTWCCAVYFLKRGVKSQIKFKLFERRVANDSYQNMASLRSNNGGKCLTQILGGYLDELVVPYSPDQNGVAERMNKLSWIQLDQWWFTKVYWTYFALMQWNVLPTSAIALQRLLSSVTRHSLKSEVERNQIFPFWKCMCVWRMHMCQTHKERSLTRRQRNLD